MQTITINTHEDAIAAVPHLLGFHLFWTSPSDPR